MFLWYNTIYFHWNRISFYNFIFINIKSCVQILKTLVQIKLILYWFINYLFVPIKLIAWPSCTSMKLFKLIKKVYRPLNHCLTVRTINAVIVEKWRKHAGVGTTYRNNTYAGNGKLIQNIWCVLWNYDTQYWFHEDSKSSQRQTE